MNPWSRRRARARDVVAPLSPLNWRRASSRVSSGSSLIDLREQARHYRLMTDQHAGPGSQPPSYGTSQGPYGSSSQPPPFGYYHPPYGYYQAPYGPPRQPQPHQLRRSRTNRRVAGVAGGLAEYLGVDDTVIRIGFVLVSVMFLAVFGGLVLYAIAWAVMPEEGQGAAPAQGYAPGQGYPPGQPWQPGQPWPRPDRTARSWALVLGAAALALVWSFGLARWWHSGASFAWLVFAGLAVWFFARCRHAGPGARSCGPWARGGQRAPGPQFGAPPNGSAGGGYTQPSYAQPSGAQPSDAQPDAGEPGAAGEPSAPEQTSAAGQPQAPGAVPTQGAAPEQGPTAAQGAPPVGLSAEEAADWAAAQTAAAGWAQEQLAAAGVPGPASSGPAPAGGPWPAFSRQARRRYKRRTFRAVVAAFFAALVLLVVAGVVAVTLWSGGSLNGGVGNASMQPASLSQVRSHYRQGVGHLEVDLSRVRFPDRGRQVDVSLGVGDLQLVLPRRTVVNLDASSGVAGRVHLPDGEMARQAFQGELGKPASLVSGDRSSPRVPHLTVDAHVGVGVINVSWGSSAP